MDGDRADGGGSSGPPVELVRSSRDPDALRPRLEAWLATRLPVGAAPTVTELHATSATGMSSETVLFDAAWTELGAARRFGLVARLAPDTADVPVFPTYELERQFRAIRRVAELTSVPVPSVWWYEGDPEPVGAPFFVMSRVDGEVPPDILPYNFGDNWLFDADPVEQRRLQDTSVELLAALHAVEDPEVEFDFLAIDAPGSTALDRKRAQTRAWYEWGVEGGARSPLVDRAFSWLDDHKPSDEGPAVLSWGDSRIGNVIYRDFVPVAALDWEMACLGPRELDVAWMAYAHQVFEDIAADLGAPGMPSFLRLDDVATTYESLTGVRLRDLQFFTVLAAVQYAIVFLRTGRRAVHFGEREQPEHVDELIMNRAGLERVMSASQV